MVCLNHPFKKKKKNCLPQQDLVNEERGIKLSSPSMGAETEEGQSNFVVWVLFALLLR